MAGGQSQSRPPARLQPRHCHSENRDNFNSSEAAAARQERESLHSAQLSPEQLTHFPLSRQVGRWAGRLSEWSGLPNHTAPITKGLWD